jgi:hypothetical protein
MCATRHNAWAGQAMTSVRVWPEMQQQRKRAGTHPFADAPINKGDLSPQDTSACWMRVCDGTVTLL